MLDSESQATAPVHTAWYAHSGDDFVDHAAGDVGQPEVPTVEAVGQPLVVDPQQMQDRGVQVVHADTIFDGLVSELVAGTVLHAALGCRRRPSTS